MNKTINKIKWLLFKRNVRKQGYPIMNITDEVIRKYKVVIKNNESDSDILVILKLSRNYHAGQQIFKNNNVIIKAYGCLHITLNRENNMIIDIKNYKSYSEIKKGYINFDIKDRLNELYGIDLLEEGEIL